MTADTQISNLENVLRDAKNSLLKRISQSPKNCLENFRIDTLIDNAREKLDNMREPSKIIKKPFDQLHRTPPRIPDLSANDKKKIIDLVDLLAKTNEEKERFSIELIQKQSEIDGYEAKLAKITSQHNKEQQKLMKQIVDLKTASIRGQQSKDAELIIFKTEKEIEVKKLKYDNALKIQEVEIRMRNEFKKLKEENNERIFALENENKKLQNKIDTKMKPLVEKDQESEKIIVELKKEKTVHEEKINSCKIKLKTAIEAIQRLKQKLDIYQNIKINIRNQGTQTIFGSGDEVTATATEVAASSSWNQSPVRSRPSTPQSIASSQFTDQAVLSELFFTKDPVSAILEPVFFHNKPLIGNSQSFWSM